MRLKQIMGLNPEEYSFLNDPCYEFDYDEMADPFFDWDYFYGEDF